MIRSVLPLIPLLVVIIGAEALVQFNVIPSYLLPAPSSVVDSLIRESGDLWRAAGWTSVCALLGFALSLLIGISFGFVLSISKTIERIFYPYAVFFQTVPIIAIAPLLVIWFGYGTPTVIASAFIVSVFPVIASTLSGLLSADPALHDLFQLYGSSRMDRLFKLEFPSALPSLMTGARIASGLAVIGAIVGEFIGGGGLGGIVDEARSQQRVDRVFAAVLLASVLGLFFFAVINALSRFLLRNWHASEQSKSK